MQIKLDRDKRYLLACSYGPDSMALFSVLTRDKYMFAIAHVNYGLRGEESDLETGKLIQYCKDKNIECFVRKINGKNIRGNFQNAARKIRYEFFKEIAETHNFDALLTAHHADDVIETYLMQKSSKRETFYYGIRDEIIINGLKVIRPFLHYYKDELIAHCIQNKIPFATDSSNLELIYTRNRIRHNLVKKMSKDEKDEMRKELNYQNKKLNTLTQRLNKLSNNDIVLISDFKDLNEKERQHLLYLLFLKHGIPKHFSASQKLQIEAIIFGKKSSSMNKIFDSISLVKYEGKFSLINLKEYAPYSYVIKTPKTIKTPQFTVKLGKNGVFPQFDNSQYPITIASQGPNQKYKIKGYEKTINRLFIDMKMPRHYRLIWPIVSNKKGEVIYVPRYRANYIPKETDLFKIHIK